MCTNNFLDHPISKQSINDCSSGLECSQPQISHPTDGIQTSFEALCSQHMDHSRILAVEVPVMKQLTENTMIETEQELPLEGDSVPAAVSPVVNRQNTSQPVEVDVTFKPVINCSEEDEQEAVINVGQQPEGDINQSILAPDRSTLPTELTIEERRKKRRAEMKDSFAKHFPMEDMWKKPTSYDSEIPESSAEFFYHKRTVRICVEQLLKAPIVARGAFGEVSRVGIKGSPRIRMAAKRVSRSHYTEVATMKRVGTKGCPYIIEYYCAMFEPNADRLFICMEFMDASLEKFYRTMHSLGKIPAGMLERLVCRIIHNIASGLHVLEGERIVHQDIKPANMLINKNAVAKLCDFGVSRTFDELQSASESVAFTAYYIPPKRDLSIQDDMWSLGISLVEFIDNKNPFAGMNPETVQIPINLWTPTVPTTISLNLQELLLSLLEKKAVNRPCSYAEILDHPIIRNVTTEPSSDERAFVRHVIAKIP